MNSVVSSQNLKSPVYFIFVRVLLILMGMFYPMLGFSLALLGDANNIIYQALLIIFISFFSVLIFLSNNSFKRIYSVFLDRFIFLILIYFVWIFISIFWSINNDLIRLAFLFVREFSFFVSTCLLLKTVSVAFAARYWLVGYCISVTIQTIFVITAGFNFDERLNGVGLIEPNAFSANIALLSLVFLLFGLKQKRLIKFVFFLVLQFGIYFLMYLAFSKTSIAALAFSTAVLVLFSGKKKFTKNHFIFILFIASQFLISLPFLIIKYQKYSVLNDTLTGRTGAWEYMAPIVFNSLPLGLGFLSSEVVANNYSIVNRYFSGTTLHNEYLQILCNFGVVGIIMGVIIGVQYLRQLKLYTTNNNYLVAIFGLSLFLLYLFRTWTEVGFIYFVNFNYLLMVYLYLKQTALSELQQTV